ncbi:proteasome activator pa28, REG alpha/beta subunit [Flagelloscypha sp. PMI_526]|nr:proteasome activator pa28, REG alpha/beta subunit [Flagelloscypha sp. PMI_526]
MSLTPDLADKLSNFHKEVQTNGEYHIFNTFPQKIMYAAFATILIISLKSLIPQPIPPLDLPSSSEPSAKKRKLANGSSEEHANDNSGPRYSQVVKHNHRVVELQAKVKQEAEEMARTVDLIKLWITLAMPKIEDGDNFGVQIQEEILTELQRAQETLWNLRDTGRAYHGTRSKICSKLIKYPNVEDYTDQLKEHDGRSAFHASQNIHDIRNLYAILTDLIHKNIAKIRAPKANNGIALY